MTQTHTALYRTHRPQKFKDVRGQEHIVDVLEAAIKNGAISHAYLFAGTRGTGKTSIARILAREIGCTEKDLYEIDAASNRGIDDIRELREGVHVMPFDSPYKVYIIDEAHMLTKEAFNALLKTLEEPPSHAVFVLATTEEHKVPDTIRSRCEVYTFKQPSRELLAKHITDVAKKEGYTLEQSAAELIALLAEGSFRDALGMLQKVVAISKDKTVNVSEVEKVTGAPRGQLVNDVLAAIAKGERESALTALGTAVEANTDMRTFTKLLIHRIRAVLLMRHAPDMEELVKKELSDDDLALAKELAKEAKTLNSQTLRALLEAYSTQGYAVIPHLPLELAIVDVTAEKEDAEKTKKAEK